MTQMMNVSYNMGTRVPTTRNSVAKARKPRAKKKLTLASFIGDDRWQRTNGYRRAFPKFSEPRNKRYYPRNNSFLIKTVLYPEDVKNIGWIIGPKGEHFCRITEKCGVDYIWYSMKDGHGVVDIWGRNRDKTISAYHSLIRHILSFRR